MNLKIHAIKSVIMVAMFCSASHGLIVKNGTTDIITKAKLVIKSESESINDPDAYTEILGVLKKPLSPGLEVGLETTPAGNKFPTEFSNRMEFLEDRENLYSAVLEWDSKAGPQSCVVLYISEPADVDMLIYNNEQTTIEIINDTCRLI